MQKLGRVSACVGFQGFAIKLSKLGVNHCFFFFHSSLLLYFFTNFSCHFKQFLWGQFYSFFFIYSCGFVSLFSLNSRGVEWIACDFLKSLLCAGFKKCLHVKHIDQVSRKHACITTKILGFFDENFNDALRKTLKISIFF